MNTNEFVFNKLKSKLEDWNISYNPELIENPNEFNIVSFKGEPDISYINFEIEFNIGFETFLDYLYFWTKEFEESLNSAFNIKLFDYISESKHCNCIVTLNASKRG